MRTAVAVALLTIVVLSGCTAPAASPAPGDAGGEPSATDLSFAEVADEAGLAYEPDEGGAGNGNDGLYVADYDDDLREDVLALGGDSPVLFRNTGGGFERSGALPNVSEPGVGRVQGALWFDHDGDGREDLLLLRRYGTPVLLENDGGHFERRDAGFETEFDNPVAATTADYDGDGCLDLFVGQYGLWSEASPEAWNDQFFESDNGNPNALYRGHCGDGFERVRDAGVGPTGSGPHWSLAASFADLTGDGRPDVHVANDYYNDTAYVNDGDGTFTRMVLGNATDRNGMSSEVVDLTADDRPEVFVTNIYFPRDRVGELGDTDRRLFSNFLANRLGKRLKGNNLLAGTDDGASPEARATFEDRGEAVGLAEGGWGWAAVAADLDGDGDRDVLHGTQDVVTFDESAPVYSLPMAWVQHDGEFHRQDGGEVGFGVSDDRGVVRFDYDLDGALDVGVATYDEPYLLYRNDGPQGNSLQVVVDGGPNRTAVGAAVYAIAAGETRRYLRNARADYQSQDSRVVHVGLGDAEAVDELRVIWPDGIERTFENVSAGQRIRVTPDGIKERRDYGE
jgi:hypothetical protein